jgi:HPt (histidine-containing phosphotransfer) domain-containing protein
MNSPDETTSRSETPDIAAILDQMWVRFLPEIRDRASVLASAAAALAAGDLQNPQREAAHSAAHKLAGILGTFNLAHGTELAREFEQLTAPGDALDAVLADKLVSIAAELRIIIDSRK